MTETWWEAPMEGSVLSFLKAEWKVSDTGSAHWASSLFLKQFIISAKGYRYWSIVLYPLSSCTLFFRKVTVTLENIESQLITNQQSLTQFFKSTSNKRKPEGPDWSRNNCNQKKRSKKWELKKSRLKVNCLYKTNIWVHIHKLASTIF